MNQKGESSSEHKEKLNKMSDEPRLKKAKFAWQVKGKHHLKNNNECQGSDVLIQNESENGSNINVKVPEKCDRVNVISTIVSAEENLEMLGDYILKNAVDNVLNDYCDKTEVSTDNKVVHDELQKSPVHLHSLVESKSEPMSMVSSDFYQALEQCISQWQAKQMAKCYVDNTINRVLDSWHVAPIPHSTYNPAVQVAEYLDNLPGANSNNNIEDEGILMAISAHGLQNNISSPSKSNSQIQTHNSSDNTQIINKNEKVNQRERDVSNIDKYEISEDDKRTRNEEPPAWAELEQPCVCSQTFRNNLATVELKPLVPFHRRDPKKPFAYLSSTSQETKTNGYKSDSSKENDEKHNDVLFSDEFDFMDTAVSFAIQNKGLTSFGSDYI